MANKLFITNTVIQNSFAEVSSKKYSLDYFRANRWDIKYFTDYNWTKNPEDLEKYDTENLNEFEKYDIILIWSVQEDFLNHGRIKKDCLLMLISLQEQNKNKYKYRILDYIEDLHNLKLFYDLDYEFYRQHFDKASKNYIIVRYENAANIHFPNCNTYTIPYSIDQSTIPSFNQNPINELLLTGCTDGRYYPLRHTLSTLKDKYPISILEHPGYRSLSHAYTGKAYLNKINEYIASVSTCGSMNYNYIIAKYFEIPASGALLFAYADPIEQYLKKYGFEDNVNMITFDSNNLTEKIQYVLDPANRDDIDRIRLNGYNLILEKHTHFIRFNIELDKFINDLIDMKNTNESTNQPINQHNN